MSYDELIGNYQDIMQATCAEDIFGDLGTGDIDAKLNRLERIHQARQ